METKILNIFTDGGARGNPGPAAVGVLILDENENEMIRLGKRIGETTNNVAEYTAVIEALKWIKGNDNTNIEKLIFHLDSKLVVNQLNGFYKVKENHLRELVVVIRGLEQEINLKIFYKHIPREENSIADFLVNSSF